MRREQSVAGDSGVLPGVEKQWGGGGVVGVAFDLADENRMVAARHLALIGDFKHRAAARENRRVAEAGLPGQAGKTIHRPGGKAVRQIHLLGGEDVDRVVAGAAEGFEAVRAVIETPQHQRRIERNGGEGIHGQADGLAIGVDGGDDGDAGGKAA